MILKIRNNDVSDISKHEDESLILIMRIARGVSDIFSIINPTTFIICQENI